MLVLRKGSTANRAAQILFEYLPFATEPPKDGIIAYLSDCKLRGNTNRTLSNKLVRVKAFYASQFDLKITRKDVPRPTYIERVPEIYSPDDLVRFFAACDSKQKLFHKTLLQTGLRMQEARYLEFSVRTTIVAERRVDGFYCGNNLLLSSGDALRKVCVIQHVGANLVVCLSKPFPRTSFFLADRPQPGAVHGVVCRVVDGLSDFVFGMLGEH